MSNFFFKNHGPFKIIEIINFLNLDNNKFDKNYEVIKNIQSKKINIENNYWVAQNVKIYQNNESKEIDQFKLYSNFNYEKIQSLFSNLSSLSIIELMDLRKNYKSLNYSITEVDLQINKIFSYPIYLSLMTIFSAIIMFNIKRYSSSTFKISIGLFLSVIIYYINNFFNVMGKTEKFSIAVSIWLPLLILLLINIIMINRINEK